MGAPPFVNRQIQRDNSWPAEALFPADDQTAGFQFVKHPRRYLSASAEFRFGVLHSEVHADSPVRFDITFLLEIPARSRSKAYSTLAVIG